MARVKKEASLTPEERLQAALVPDWEWLISCRELVLDNCWGNNQYRYFCRSYGKLKNEAFELYSGSEQCR